MKKHFLIFIPGYNCAPQITKVLQGIKESCYDTVDEIIFVDNQSKDGTLEAARSFRDKHAMSKVTILSNHGNYGLGGSHKVAFQYAMEQNYDYVVILHGDNQADAREIPLFISRAEKSPQYDAVLGDRFSSGAKRVGYSTLRTFGNIGLNWVYSAVALHHVRDMGAGLNLVKVSKLRKLDFKSCSNFCDFHTQLLLDMLEAKWNLYYQPISWKKEDQKSNINPFVYGLTTLKILYRWRLGLGRTQDRVSRTYDIIPARQSAPASRESRLTKEANP